MELRVIRNADDYREALDRAERLVALDPETGTPDAETLEVLSILIEDYEKRRFPFKAPDPISAIEFRMEEQGLRQKDLVPLLGSRSRVSEILARKRPLTVPMIRALTAGLGIPADILVSTRLSVPEIKECSPETIDWSQFPAREMKKRGWFDFDDGTKKRSVAELVKEFFINLSADPAPVLYRRRFRGDAYSDKTRYSVLAWTARVLMRARAESKLCSPFDPTSITPDVLKELAQLSVYDAGPRLAVEFLARRGITVIVEPRLPHALLDGAALLTGQGQAVIGLTLRYDRVDAFWFTLLHEIAHVWKHLSSPEEAFVDRLENIDGDDYREKEANRLARETFVPRAVWRRSAAFLAPTRDSIQKLADDCRIHPGIIVGRLHFETGNYRTFRDLLCQGTVRSKFPQESFSRATHVIV
jgi:HTH-type transcriptional regulator/antitoxin HigA